MINIVARSLRIRWISAAICLLFSLYCSVQVCHAQTKQQQLFLTEALKLAELRSLKLVAMLPRDNYAPLNVSLPGREQSWRDSADLFSIRWKVIWRLSGNYLMIGPQYKTEGDTQDQARPNDVVTPNVKIAFIESLTDSQLETLREDDKRFKSLPLSSFSAGQLELLNKIYVPAAERGKIVNLGLETKGTLVFTFLSQALIYSNGLINGTVGFNKENKIEYESYISTSEQEIVGSAASTVKFDKPLMSLKSFVSKIVSGLNPPPKIVFDKNVDAEKTLVYSSESMIPIKLGDDAVSFVTAVEVRNVGGIYFVAPSDSISSESLYETEASFFQRPSQKVSKVISSLRPNAHQLPIDSLEPYRAYYRVELPSQTQVAMANLDPQIKMIFEKDSKIAVGAYISISVLVDIPQGGDKKNLVVAANLLRVLSPSPMEEFAFRKP